MTQLVGGPFPIPCLCALGSEAGGGPTFDYGDDRWGTGWLDVTLDPPITPAWIGRFARGTGRLDSVFGAPAPEQVGVVASGRAYFVRPLAPSVWSEVPLMPVTQVVADVDGGVLAFVGITTLAGFDRDGHCWTSEELSWDGLDITAVEDGRAVGVSWDGAQECEVPVEVDLRSGRHSGGAAPPP